MTSVGVLMGLYNDRDGPQRLYDAWKGRPGEPACISTVELSDLIRYFWAHAYGDAPEGLIGAAAWVEMLSATGFVALPTNIERPTTTLTLYRGAPPAQRAGMAWSLRHQVAEHFRQRKAKLGDADADVYIVTVVPEAVLARFDHRQEFEAVADRAFLEGAQPCECSECAERRYTYS